VLTRRTAVVSGASALIIAGCGGGSALTIAGDRRDLRVLATALEVERTQAALYEAGLTLASGALAGRARLILEHERAHAAALDEAIRELGGTPAPARPASEYSRGIPQNAGAWRKHAIGLEEQWSAGYQAVIPRLANPRLRSTFGALMTSEAEHAVALDVTR